MEVVTQFNSELKSILSSRPPVSRAKMAIITKLAVKSAKLYKHVVMHVERFLGKCPPDFKVPGLYVIDSIVRQSQHQLGAEKDPFGPRFAKNFQKTFQYIFECVEEDRPKVVRVLNLWQKNGVFASEVIQPLLSLAPVSNGVSEQWQPSATISQSAPSQGDQLHKSVDRKVLQDNAARPVGFLERQHLPPAQFDTPPNQAPPTHVPSPPANQHHQAREPVVEKIPPHSSSTLKMSATHHQTQQQLFDQALLNDFDYSDEEDEGMRVQGQKGTMQQAHQVTMPIEGTKPEGDHTSLHQQAPPPAILTNDPSRLHPTTSVNISQYPGPPQQQQQQQPPSHGGSQTLPSNHHAMPPSQQGGFVPPHVLSSSQGYPPFQGGPPPGYHGGLQTSFHGGPPPPPPPSHGGPPPRGPPPPPPHGSHGGPPSPRGGPPPHGYGPPHGFPPPQVYPPYRGPPPPSLGPVPRGPPHPIHGPAPNLPHSPNSPRPGFFPPGPGGPPNRDHHPQNYNRRSLSPPPPPLGRGSGPPPSAAFHHPPPNNPPPPPLSRPERYSSPPYRGRSPSPHHRSWRERDRDRDGSRDRERWTPPARRRSRSPMRDQKSRSPVRRRDSRSPPPWRRSGDVDRHRKGGAHPREQHYTVCSTTIWVGHLPKNVTQSQIADAFEEFGTVNSVDVVQARGCAYVVMHLRSEASRALSSLKELKLNGTSCKLAWAPGRGVKGAAFKNYWDIDLGISFIPWEKIKSQEELDSVVEGGWIDPATCPPGMKPSTHPRGEAPTAKPDASLPDSNNQQLPPGIPTLPGQPMFPTSGPPGMAAMHPGMGPPPFGISGPPPHPGGAHFHSPPALPLPPVQQRPTGPPPSHLYADSSVAAAPTSQILPSESAFGSDATTHEDMQLDDEDGADQDSGGVRKWGSNAVQERFQASGQTGSENAKHLDSAVPESSSFSDPDSLGEPGGEQEPGAEMESKVQMSADSPVLSPDNFQMSDNEEPIAYSESERDIGVDEQFEKLPQGSES